MSTKKHHTKSKIDSLFTTSIYALIIIFICTIWTFYCVYGSDFEFKDRSASFGLFTILLFMAASGVVKVGWMLVGIIAIIAIVMCISEHKNTNKRLKTNVIVKHIVVTIVAALPYIFLSFT